MKSVVKVYQNFRMHSVEKCISLPPPFGNVQPRPLPVNTHHGQIPDSMIITGIRETENY